MKKVKKIISVLLAICMLASIIPITSYAQEPELVKVTKILGESSTDSSAIKAFDGKRNFPDRWFGVGQTGWMVFETEFPVMIDNMTVYHANTHGSDWERSNKVGNTKGYNLQAFNGTGVPQISDYQDDSKWTTVGEETENMDSPKTTTVTMDKVSQYYRFNVTDCGWIINNDYGYRVMEIELSISSNMKKYNVEFQSGDGTGTMQPIKLYANTDCKLPPSRFNPPAGKVFDKWEIVSPTSVSINNNIVNSNEDIVVKAVYKDLPEGFISIDVVNFPDDAFRQYILDTYDLNTDFYLSQDEIKAVDYFDDDDISSSPSVKDLKGLEFFTSIENLTIRAAKDYELNPANFPKLAAFDAYSLANKTLDLSNNINLVYLSLESCDINDLKLDGLAKLECVEIYESKIKNVSFDNCNSLVEFSSYVSEISIDPEKSNKIETLNLFVSTINGFDFSNFPELNKLNAVITDFGKDIDLSNNTKLEYLELSVSEINSIKFPQNSGIIKLTLNSNNLNSIDLSNLPKLKILDLSFNALSDIDLSKNTKLEQVNLSQNCLKEIDFSKNPALKKVCLSNNEIEKISFASNVAMSTLDVDSNRLVSLNLPSSENVTINADKNSRVVKNNTEISKIKGFDSANVTSMVGGKIEDGKIVYDSGASKIDIEYTYDNSVYNFNLIDIDTTKYVAINSQNFPDPALRLNVSKSYDDDGDGFLSESEIQSARFFEQAPYGLEYIANDFTGIEYLTNISEFVCYVSTAKKLDLTKNTKLEYIEISITSIEEIDITGLNNLECLCCADNNISNITINNPNLIEIDLDGNKLNNIDISHCPNLEMLDISNNKIASIDTSNNPNLYEIYFNNNEFYVEDNSDISVLNGFNVNNVVSVTGGNFDNNKITFDEDSDIITYKYKASDDPNHVFEFNLVKLVHTPKPGYQFDENGHYQVCEDCGQKINVESHNLEWIIDQSATDTQTGLKHQHCSVCGYDGPSVVIPVLSDTTPEQEPSVDPNEDVDNNNNNDNGNSNNSSVNKNGAQTDVKSPQTGGTDTTLIIMVVAVSLALASCIIINNKKKKYSK